MFAFFLSSIYCYEKIICICIPSDCYSFDNDCKTQKNLDPTSPSFVDDFLYMKKNARDLILVLNNKNKGLDIAFDLRIFTGLNITFRANSYFAKNFIRFDYIHDQEYSASISIITNKPNFVTTFNCLDKNNNTRLRMNTINISTVQFYLNQTTELFINDLYSYMLSLVNVSNIIKTKVGVSCFILDKYDLLTTKVSKSSIKIIYNGTELKYNSQPGENYIIKGRSTGYYALMGNLTIELDEGASYNDLKNINYTLLKKVEFKGKLWKPTESEPLLYLIYCETVVVPPGNFPYSIFCPNIYLHLSGDTSIYGMIEGRLFSETVSATKMYLNTVSEKTINITFLDHINSNIFMQSPYLNVTIYDYRSLYTSSGTKEFPIGFSFNEYTSSHIYCEKFRIGEFDVLTGGLIDIFPTISGIYNDSELQKFPNLKDGFIFLDLPLNSFAINTFTIDVNQFSTSQLQNIPGFTKSSIHMTVEAERSNRIRLRSKLAKEKVATTAYICIKESLKCLLKKGEKYFYADIAPFSDGDLREYVGAGYKNIVISTTISRMPLFLNFDSLPEMGYNVTIKGYIQEEKSASKFKIQASDGKIDHFAIYYIKFPESMEFNSNKVDLFGCYFTKTKNYKFGDKSIITGDTITYKSLYEAGTPTIANSNLVHEMSTFKESYFSHYTRFDETLNMTNERMTICINGYEQRKGLDPRCVELNPKYLGNFSYHVNYVLKIKTDFISEKFGKLGIVIDPAENLSYKRFLMSLDGSGWTTKLENKIKVEFGSTELEIRVTKPCQSDNLDFVGTGSKIFSLDYDDHVDYCVYTNGSHPTCFTDDNTSKIIMLANDGRLFDELKNIDDSKYSINIDIDSAINAISIPLSFLDKRKIKFQTTKNSATFSKIEFLDDNGDSSIDPVYSYTILSNINASYPNQSDVTLKFGQLVIEGGFEVSDSFKEHVSLEVSQLVSVFEDLQKFKHVRVNDQITLSGSVPIEGRNVSVDFEPDEDANDLISEITCDSRIIVSSEEIKIGLFSFHITHSKNYDAYFKVKGNCNITVESQTADLGVFPKFVIDTGIYECSIRFEGGFPSISSEEESLVLILGSNKATVDSHVTGYLPLSIHNLTQVDIITHTKSLSIHGPIEYFNLTDPTNRPRITFDNYFGEAADIRIVNGIDIMRVDKEKDAKLIGIMSSNLIVSVDKITKSDNIPEVEIKAFVTISRTGASKLIISNKLPEGVSLSKNITLLSDVYGFIDDEKTFPFISKAIPVIQGQPEDISPHKYSVQYHKLDSTKIITHGFNPVSNCLKACVSSTQTTVDLLAFKKPSEIPFIIEYVADRTKVFSDLVIDKSNIEILSNISKYIPTDVKTVIFNANLNMNSSYPLNLDGINAHLYMRSVEDMVYEAHTTAPSDKDLSVSYQLLKLSLKTKSSQQNLEAEFLNFTDCTFLNPGDFRITSASVKSLGLDVDSLNDLIQGGSLKSFGNSMRVNSANVIVFTSEGWEFREDRSKPTSPIKSSDFTDVSFETRMLCSLIIADESMTSIHGFDFDSYAQDDGISYFELSRHWGRIKELNGFKIKVNSADRISVDTASYPIPAGMFDESSSHISYTFKSDEHGNFDSITIDDGKVYHDEKFSVDFQFLDEEHQIIRGKSATFTGNNEFVFANDVGKVQLDEITVASNSKATFSNLEITNSLTLQEGSTLDAAISFNPMSKIHLYWTLDSIPLIKQRILINEFPAIFELFYNNSTVDMDAYNTKLLFSGGIIIMKGNFNCPTLRSRIKFSGKFASFGSSNEYLTTFCDAISEGQILVLKGIKEMTNADSSQSGENKGAKVSTGGIVGIVIACIIVVAVAAFIVYCIQRRRIDKLKNIIPAETNETYNDSRYDESKTSIDIGDDEFSTDIF